MRLIVGADIVHEMDRWWSPERVRELAPPIVLGRVGVAPAAGYDDVPRVLPEVSSTAIRTALARGERLDALLVDQPQRLLGDAAAAEDRLGGASHLDKTSTVSPD